MLSPLALLPCSLNVNALTKCRLVKKGLSLKEQLMVKPLLMSSLSVTVSCGRGAGGLVSGAQACHGVLLAASCTAGGGGWGVGVGGEKAAGLSEGAGLEVLQHGE